MLKTGTQGVKKTWGGGPDLARLVASHPDPELDGASMTMSGNCAQKTVPGSHLRAAMCCVR